MLVFLYKKLRRQIKFKDKEQLKRHIEKDIKKIKSLLRQHIPLLKFDI